MACGRVGLWSRGSRRVLVFEVVVISWGVMWLGEADGVCPWRRNRVWRIAITAASYFPFSSFCLFFFLAPDVCVMRGGYARVPFFRVC